MRLKISCAVQTSHLKLYAYLILLTYSPTASRNVCIKYTSNIQEHSEVKFCKGRIWELLPTAGNSEV
jgi:hypothetical protein